MDDGTGTKEMKKVLDDRRTQMFKGNAFLPWSGSRIEKGCDESSSPSTGTRSGKRTSCAQCLTSGLVNLYTACAPDKFKYSATRNPRRCLTKDSKPCGNRGRDNRNADLILRVHDTLIGDQSIGFNILNILGSGTFGQVVECEEIRRDHLASGGAGRGDLGHRKLVAVKIIKNSPAYFNQAVMETRLLAELNMHRRSAAMTNARGRDRIVIMLGHFMHHDHLCIVFEKLDANLYDVLKARDLRGLSLRTVRCIGIQLLDALDFLEQCGVIHADLKPENILLERSLPIGYDDSKNDDDARHRQQWRVKICDFGSACYEYSKTFRSYIQSRFYRAPEALLGLPYTYSLDMWSLGCILVELYVGIPLFPGSSEHDQIARIVRALGKIPEEMLRNGKKTHMFYQKRVSARRGAPTSDEEDGEEEMGEQEGVEDGNSFGRKRRRIPTARRDEEDGKLCAIGRRRRSRRHNRRGDEYASAQSYQLKRYVDTGKRKNGGRASIVAKDVISFLRHRRGKNSNDHSKASFDAFVHFVHGMLDVDPDVRWTSFEALQHPFVTSKIFKGTFIPSSRSDRYRRDRDVEKTASMPIAQHYMNATSPGPYGSPMHSYGSSMHSYGSPPFGMSPGLHPLHASTPPAAYPGMVSNFALSPPMGSILASSVDALSRMSITPPSVGPVASMETSPSMMSGNIGMAMHNGPLQHPHYYRSSHRHGPEQARSTSGFHAAHSPSYAQHLAQHIRSQQMFRRQEQYWFGTSAPQRLTFPTPAPTSSHRPHLHGGVPTQTHTVGVSKVRAKITNESPAPSALSILLKDGDADARRPVSETRPIPTSNFSAQHEVGPPRHPHAFSYCGNSFGHRMQWANRHAQ